MDHELLHLHSHATRISSNPMPLKPIFLQWDFNHISIHGRWKPWLQFVNSLISLYHLLQTNRILSYFNQSMTSFLLTHCNKSFIQTIIRWKCQDSWKAGTIIWPFSNSANSPICSHNMHEDIRKYFRKIIPSLRLYTVCIVSTFPSVLSFLESEWPCIKATSTLLALRQKWKTLTWLMKLY